MKVKIWTRELNRDCDADIQAALMIFRQAFADCWDESFLRKALAKNHRGLLSGSGGLACGALVYRRNRSDRDIRGLGVLRDATRLGFATAMLRDLKSLTVRDEAFRTISASIPSENQVAQHTFFRAGFQWVWTEPAATGQMPLRVFRWVPFWPGDPGSTETSTKPGRL